MNIQSFIGLLLINGKVTDNFAHPIEADISSLIRNWPTLHGYRN